MKIKNILVSQNAPADFEKSPYAELKKKYSINMDFFKFFRVEGLTSREFREEKVNILDHDAIVFSSKNTIDYFFSLVKELRIDLPEDMKYFCTTDQIAFYLQNYIQFRKRKIFFNKNNDANGIFDLFLKNPEYNYLVPRGADSTNSHYTDFLDEHNIKYAQAVIFKTVPADLKSAIDITKYDMIIFFSPAGIHSLLSNYPDFQQGEVAIGALGDAAANAVTDAGFTLHVKAPTKECPSITSAMDVFLKEYATRKR
ncbi:MAG: uroporphyrinogen-III synthase [Bacteroidales bacterium]|nr:uroporphyrinogen-III synthase [Bacteroidales bacterium]MDD6583116.1 uroporphyrinogen-III synthase [Bacteroidales bacterium]